MAIGIAAVHGFAENAYSYDSEPSYSDASEDGNTESHEEYVPRSSQANNSSQYTNYTGRVCKDEAFDNQLCFVGVDYTAHSLEAHEVCWSHCAAEYAQSHTLLAAHARIRDRVCCCRSKCDCLEVDVDAKNSLAISVTEDVSECNDFDIMTPGDNFVDPTYQKILGATCGVGTAECSTVRQGNETACAKLCGERPAVLNGDSCCCFDDCDCLEWARGSIFVKLWTSKPLPDCPAADRTYTAYRNADCNLKETAATSDLGNTGGHSAEKLERCAEICANANESNVAAIVSPTRESCSCYTSCKCITPSESTDVAILPSSELFIGDNEECSTPLTPAFPEHTEYYEEFYDTYPGISCGRGDKFICQIDFKYDLTRSPWHLRYDCWEWCYERHIEEFGKLEAVYGNPYAGECCCISDCLCFAERDADYTLSFLANGTLVPGHCENGDEDDDPKKVGPFHFTDVWWIVLIVIFGSVGVAFFIAVEEIDKERRNKLSKAKLRSELEPSSKPTQDSKENDRHLDN